MNDHEWKWYVDYCPEGKSEWIRIWCRPTRKEARVLVKEFKKDDKKLGFKHKYKIDKEEDYDPSND